MTIEHGIIIGGIVQPGTEWVLRDPSAWWDHTGTGYLPRAGHIVDQAVLHWTGSAPSVGPGAVHQAVRNTKARKGASGKPLKVGVHFYVFPDAVYQTADLADAHFHVGHRSTARRSIGIECDWPGTHAHALKLGWEHEVVRGVAKGLPVKCAAPPPAITAHAVVLVNALCAIDHPAVRIPRRRGRIGKAGILEHADMPAPSTKVDTAGVFYAPLGL